MVVWRCSASLRQLFMHGFILLEIDGQFRLGQDPDETFRRCVATMLTGLA